MRDYTVRWSVSKMTVLSSLISVALIAGCANQSASTMATLSASVVQNPSAPSKTDPWSLSVGSYDFVSTNQPPGGRNFYDAHSDSLGVGGDFDFQTVLNATEIKGVVDCITVSGNEAAMHGTVTYSNPMGAYGIGSDVVWRVLGPTSTTKAAMSVPQPGSGQCCSGGFNACNPPLFNIKNGVLIVKSG